MLFTTLTASGPHAGENGKFIGSATGEVYRSFDSSKKWVPVAEKSHRL